MSEKVKKLTPRKRKAIAELVQAKPRSEVAELVGVTERTLSRWSREPSFKAELRRAEMQVLDGVSLRLLSLASNAVAAIQDVMENPSVRGASVKRLAAKDVLELLLKWREIVVLEERVSRLEGQVLNGKFRK